MRNAETPLTALAVTERKVRIMVLPGGSLTTSRSLIPPAPVI